MSNADSAGVASFRFLFRGSGDDHLPVPPVVNHTAEGLAVAAPTAGGPGDKIPLSIDTAYLPQVVQFCFYQPGVDEVFAKVVLDVATGRLTVVVNGASAARRPAPHRHGVYADGRDWVFEGKPELF